MLNQVLQEIESTQGTLTLNDLSRKLGIERGVLDGMIQFWVRKGRLLDEDAVDSAASLECSGGSCGASCVGLAECAFVAKMPKTYSLPKDKSDVALS
jgi:hypothetical protein